MPKKANLDIFQNRPCLMYRVSKLLKFDGLSRFCISMIFNFYKPFNSSISISPIYKGAFVELKIFFWPFESVAKSPKNPFPSDLTGTEEEV